LESTKKKKGVNFKRGRIKGLKGTVNKKKNRGRPKQKTWGRGGTEGGKRERWPVVEGSMEQDKHGGLGV